MKLGRYEKAMLLALAQREIPLSFSELIKETAKFLPRVYLNTIYFYPANRLVSEGFVEEKQKGKGGKVFFKLTPKGKWAVSQITGGLPIKNFEERR